MVENGPSNVNTTFSIQRAYWCNNSISLTSSSLSISNESYIMSIQKPINILRHQRLITIFLTLIIMNNFLNEIVCLNSSSMVQESNHITFGMFKSSIFMFFIYINYFCFICQRFYTNLDYPWYCFFAV